MSEKKAKLLRRMQRENTRLRVIAGAVVKQIEAHKRMAPVEGEQWSIGSKRGEEWIAACNKTESVLNDMFGVNRSIA